MKFTIYIHSEILHSSFTHFCSIGFASTGLVLASRCQFACVLVFSHLSSMGFKIEFLVRLPRHGSHTATLVFPYEQLSIFI